MGAGWWASVFQNSLSRTCVPWLFLCSGDLLLSPRKTRPIGRFYARRFRRLLGPFLFWAAIYLWWRVEAHGETLSPRIISGMLLDGSVYYHFWFLYALAGLYLAAPFLETLRANLKEREFGVFLLLWFAFASILPWIEWAGDFEIGIPLGWFTSYFGYFLLGAWFREHRPLVNHRRLTLVISIALWALTLIATGWISVRDEGAINEVFLAYLAPNIVLLSVLGFSWMLGIDWEKILDRSRPMGRVLSTLSKASLGIYLGHVLVLEWIPRFLPLPDITSPFRPLLLLIATLLVSALLVMTGRAVPLLRRVVG